MIATLAEYAIAGLLVLGGLFGLIGSWGLIRLGDSMQRLHAPTKASTIGVGTALVASACDMWLVQGSVALQEVLVALFLFVTAPLAALMMAKVVLAGRPGPALPPTGTDQPWASQSGDGPR